MRGIAVIGIFLLTIFWASGQQLESNQLDFEKYLEKYLNTTPKEEASVAPITDYLTLLEEKREIIKKDLNFLRYLFAKTHAKFLKNYREYTSFAELLNNGYYNCLTGTALYALLLEHFHYDFNIIETNYHIFIEVTLDKRIILFETTDPIDGFVVDSKEVYHRLAYYRENRLAEQPYSRRSQNAYKFSFDLFRYVSLDELTGLLYYNLAVDAFNHQNIRESIVFLNKAKTCYKSPRLKELAQITLLAMVEREPKLQSHQLYAQSDARP